MTPTETLERLHDLPPAKNAQDAQNRLTLSMFLIRDLIEEQEEVTAVNQLKEV